MPALITVNHGPCTVAKWCADVTSESDDDDTSSAPQPAIPFSSEVFRCYTSPECEALVFGRIEQYQQHIMSHFGMVCYLARMADTECVAESACALMIGPDTHSTAK